MRKITSISVESFEQFRAFKQSNTEVQVRNGSAFLYLWDNLIAKTRMVYEDDGTSYRALSITTAGWFTVTTKERLNGLPGVSIYQRDGVWYLNGKAWDGEWIDVPPVFIVYPKIVKTNY